jgi:Uma2 family endonuclease
MSVVTNRPSANRIILRNVSWDTYERLLKDLEDSSSPRLTFDQGVLEIMSPHLDHEETNRTLASLIEMALEEMDLDFRNAGSTTFKRETLERGFEPDSCFHIQSVEQIRNKRRIDMEVDPPPDLLIEIDLTNDSLNKFPLYAALGVPEVWRYESALEIWMLDQSRYRRCSTSAAIPILNDKLVSQFLESSLTTKRPAWLRQVRKKIRALIP